MNAWRTRYERKLSQAAGVKLIPMKQTTAQKLASMVVSTMGRKEYIPREILFTKPSLVFGSDPRPGSSVDIAITASGAFLHRFVLASVFVGWENLWAGRKGRLMADCGLQHRGGGRREEGRGGEG